LGVAIQIWIDNDACPRRIREIIFKAGKRVGVKIMVVANSYMHPPAGQDVEVKVVGGEFDAADNYIAETVERGDLVITADVPLAGRVVERGAVAISPRGRLFTAESIKEQLAIRNLSQELRSGGELVGGPKAIDNQDINRFAAAFDKLLASSLKR
jgi:uncharacterized protein YaiI (UPF0178 family)